MAKRSKSFLISRLLTSNGIIQDSKLKKAATLDSEEILDFDLSIEPETFTFNVDAPDAGQNAAWKWSWDAGTVAYDRAKISNVTQGNVPLYKKVHTHYVTLQLEICIVI